VLLAGLLAGLAGATAFLWPEQRRPPRLIGILGFIVGTNVAAVIAWVKAFRGERSPVWEPTRRS
jgi:hypothetical protein